ncbi:MAG: tetratricopeptide repeat protein [Candidatus Electrothrix communis]|nr:MAG: tetratricopeptide repeat protein [Candidatus Electrothrix communis]
MTALLVLLLLLGTLVRNKVWLTEQSLWADSLKKAPNSTGPYINLGLYYLVQENNLQKAFRLNQLSLEKHSATPWKSRFWAYQNMGYIMKLIGNYDKALQLYNHALSESKDTPYGKYNAPLLSIKAQVLWLTGEKHEAMGIMSGLTVARPGQMKYLQQYGEMLIGMNSVNEGMAMLQQVLDGSNIRSKEYRNSLLDFALVYARLGFAEKSFFYINFAHVLDVPTVPSLLCFVEASILAKEEDKADNAITQLLLEITWAEFIAILEKNQQTLQFSP